MTLQAENVLFVSVTCDLCNETKARLYEYPGSYPVQDLYRKEGARANRAVPKEWLILERANRTHEHPFQYLCPPCVAKTQRPEPSPEPK